MNYTYDAYGSIWLLSDEEEPKPIFQCLTNDFELGRKVAVFLSEPEPPDAIPLGDALAFAMYYHSQMFMSNMQVISIAELYEYWNTNIKPQTT